MTQLSVLSLSLICSKSYIYARLLFAQRSRSFSDSFNKIVLRIPLTRYAPTLDSESTTMSAKQL
jgi:hypothetical protein